MIHAAAVLTGVALLALPPAAVADQTRPRTDPVRDVEVTYTLTNGNRQIQERSRWQAAAGLQRVDTPGGAGTYMIANRPAHAMAMVNDATRQVVELHAPAGALNGGAASFTRLGTLTVAGLACTEWVVIPSNGTPGDPNEVCLTDDGVLLRIREGANERARATLVTYAPADPAVFVVPQDYARVSPKPPATHE